MEQIRGQCIHLQPRKQGHRFLAMLFLLSMLLQRCGSNGLHRVDDGATTIAVNRDSQPKPSPEQSETPLSKVLPPALPTIVYNYVGGLNGLKWTIYTESLCEKEADLQARCNELEKGFFGEERWRKYYGEVEAEPPIPDYLFRLYTQPCKLWLSKKVYETHLLTLIPATVDGEALTLDSFRKMTKQPKHGAYKRGYSYYNDAVKNELGYKGVVASHWALMTRDVIKESRGKSRGEHLVLLMEKNELAKIDYMLPPILDGVVSTLCHHVVGEERLFPDSPCTYSRCLESINNNQNVSVFGVFSSGGLRVDCYQKNFDHADIGVAFLVR